MDMYTGIIQDAQFVGPDSYLRRKIDQLALDKQHNWGRIWRITLRGHDARSAAAADVREHAGATGQAPRARRTAGGATPRRRAGPAPGQVRGAGAADDGADLEQSARAGSTRCGRSRALARSTRRWCVS